MSETMSVRFEGAPETMAAWLATLGWSAQHGINSGPTDPRVLGFGPFEVRAVMGADVGFVLLAVAQEIAPPEGIYLSEIGAAVTGGFMVGPVLPTPREWMDRLPMQRQLEIYTAAQEVAALGFALYRLAASQAVDVSLAETVAFVGEMHAAGVISADEQVILLAR